jgi:DNA primase
VILTDLAMEVGLSPKKVAGTEGGEYHSACPACGREDRFIIQPYKKMKNCFGRYFCRKCGIHGDSIQFAMDILGLNFRDAIDRTQATLLCDNKGNFFSHNLKEKRMSSFEKIILPKQEWRQRATSFIERSHMALLDCQEQLQYLEKRGLPIKAIKMYKIGYNPTNHMDNGNSWRITEGDIWLPRSIVIPSWQKNTPVRIKMRRIDYNKEDGKPKYVAVTGSMNGLNIIGGCKNSTVFFVESELDAYVIHHNILDRNITVIAIGGSTKNPDNVSDYIVGQASQVFICYDNDEGGAKMLMKLQKLYPHAKPTPTPVGKDIGEAIQQGFDIADWLNTFLPQKDIIAQAPDGKKEISGTKIHEYVNTIPPAQTIINSAEKIETTKQSIDPAASEPIIMLTCQEDMPWGENQKLVDWFINAKNLPGAPFVLITADQEREDVSNPHDYYICLNAAVKDGPGKLSKGLAAKFIEILTLLKNKTKQD